MATIKAYTDIEQSKKLEKLLPIESADMYWDLLSKDKYAKVNNIGHCLCRTCIYAWSLSALLDIIPKRIKDYNVLRIDISNNNFAIWYNDISYGTNTDLPNITTESAIDACVTMIEKLHELDLL